MLRNYFSSLKEDGTVNQTIVHEMIRPSTPFSTLYFTGQHAEIDRRALLFYFCPGNV